MKERAPAEGARQEIEAALNDARGIAVATAAGDGIRSRLMPFAFGQDFTVYLALKRGDPRAMLVAFNPAVSLLAITETSHGGEQREVEISGKGFLVQDADERQKAYELLNKRAPVSGGQDAPAYIRVVPQRIEVRTTGETAEGAPAAVLEFPENRLVASDWSLLKRKALAWLLAVRAPFLTATVAPIVLGGAVAWATRDSLNWGLFFLALTAGAFLHMGANVFNDYFDHLSGDDTINRDFVRPFSGGSRAIQMGLLTPLETLTGAILLCTVSGSIGAVLAWAAGPLVLAFGAIGLISAIFYVGGPFKWASRGIGELVVGLNFGTLMTLGSYYVQTERVDWTPAIASIPVAALIAAVLYINEFPDFAADRAVGKKTWVVRLGRERAAIAYAFLMAVPYVAVIAAVAADVLPVPTLLSLLTLPLAARAVQCALRYHSQPLELAPANALTIVTHIATGLLLTLGYVWEGSDLGGIGYVVGFAVLFALIVAFISRGIEQEKRAFLAAREAL
jgi:1,4-dihydroxy-2-naphthoate octaprenyltransferase